MQKKLNDNKVFVDFNARAPSLDKQWFSLVIQTAARIARKPDRNVQIILVGDKRMKDLNSVYRNKKTTTDVLSFPSSEIPLEASKLGYAPEHDDAGYMGEIVLCVPQLRRQARQYGVSFKTETARMTIHGFLHLWGYDHIKPKDARIMMPLQEKALAKCVAFYETTTKIN